MPRTCRCTNSRLTHRRAFAFQPRGILLFTYERVCSQCRKAAGALGKHADPAADVMVDRTDQLQQLQYPMAVLSYKRVAASGASGRRHVETPVR